MLRFLLDCRLTVKPVFPVSAKGVLTGCHIIVFLRDTIQGRSITNRRKLMTPDYCSRKVHNCWWDCYINEAVLELSSISWREIFEFQKITHFKQNPETKADENVVILYLVFSRTFSLMEMSVLCLNENIKGRDQGFVHISKYLNYSIVMKLSLFPWNVPLHRSINVAL